MTNKRKLVIGAMSILGVILLLLGCFVFTSKNLIIISRLCIGFGSSMSVLGIGHLGSFFILSVVENKEMKQLEVIEMNDERNIRIKEKSSYMVIKIMNYMISVLILALGFMNVNRMILIMIASFFLVELILVIIFSNYYSKTM